MFEALAIAYAIVILSFFGGLLFLFLGMLAVGQG
jgi:hypothetical protein